MKKRTRTCEHFENLDTGCSNGEGEKSRTEDNEANCNEQGNWESWLPLSNLRVYSRFCMYALSLASTVEKVTYRNGTQIFII